MKTHSYDDSSKTPSLRGAGSGERRCAAYMVTAMQAYGRVSKIPLLSAVIPEDIEDPRAGLRKITLQLRSFLMQRHLGVFARPSDVVLGEGRLI